MVAGPDGPTGLLQTKGLYPRCSSFLQVGTGVPIGQHPKKLPQMSAGHSYQLWRSVSARRVLLGTAGGCLQTYRPGLCTGSACPVLPATSGSSLGTWRSSTGTLGTSTGTLSSGKLRNGWPDFTAWHTCETSERMGSNDGAEQHRALPTPVPLPACLVTDPARPFPPCQPRFLPSGETLEPALGSLLLQRLRLSPKTLFLHFS